MPTPLSFYAVTRTGSTPFELQKVPLERPVQDELTSQFEEQSREFVGLDVKLIEFDANYKIQNDDNEVFVETFVLPEFLSVAINATDEDIDDLQSPFTPDAPMVKAIVGVDAEAESFYFQLFEKRQILESTRCLLFRGDTFNRIQEPVITMGTRLAATIVDGELRFKSFHIARRFLDLSELFNDATDESITELLGHSKLHVVDAAAITSRLSSRLRKRFASVIASGILDEDRISPQMIQSRAKKYTNLDGLKLQGPAKAHRLVLPDDLATLERLLRFLCEELYVGDLTERERVTNSSRFYAAVND